MPMYEAQCLICGNEQDYHRTVANYLDTPECCGQKMQKMISAPSFIVDIPAYVSPVSGKLINSRQQRKEDLKRTNCREWEGMEQENKVAQQRAKDEEKRQDAKIEEAVLSAWNQLPSEKRKVLEQAA